MSNQQPVGFAGIRATPVAGLTAEARAAFLTRTYVHLFGAIVAFTGLEMVLFNTGLAEQIMAAFSGSWMLVLGGFMLVSWVARSAAHRASSPVAQYAALAGFVAAEALIFAPLLVMAFYSAPGAISSAAGVTLVGFALLTMLVFLTGKDFSFLRSVMTWGGLCAMGLIVASLIFGWHLGTWFSVGMVAFAGAAILYDTSKILHHYPDDKHVAASLELFASVALMFWYVLRLFMSRD